MATLGAVVALVLGALGVIVLTSLVFAVLLHLVDRYGSAHDRPVMPSHYSSLPATDLSKYPGYCTECGTRNDPEFEVCRNCSARISTQRPLNPDWDPEDVFDV